MESTQQDFEDRKARIDAGTGSDEDRRLVKQYEKQGFAVGGAQQADRAPDASRPADVDADAADAEDKTSGRGRTNRK